MLIFRQGPGYAGVFCFSAIPNLRVSEALKTEDQARQMQKEDHFPLHFLPTRAIRLQSTLTARITAMPAQERIF